MSIDRSETPRYFVSHRDAIRQRHVPVNFCVGLTLTIGTYPYFRRQVGSASDNVKISSEWRDGPDWCSVSRIALPAPQKSKFHGLSTLTQRKANLRNVYTFLDSAVSGQRSGTKYTLHCKRAPRGLAHFLTKPACPTLILVPNQLIPVIIGHITKWIISVPPKRESRTHTSGLSL
jgi:hypothetical protein